MHDIFDVIIYDGLVKFGGGVGIGINRMLAAVPVILKKFLLNFGV